MFRDKVRGDCGEEVPGGFRGPGRVLDGTFQNVLKNDLVADGGAGFRGGSFGEPVAIAVALVPALILV